MAGEKNKKSGRNTAKKQPAKSSGGKIRPWLALTAVFLLIGAYFYLVNLDDPAGEKAKGREYPKVENYQVEKTGAGANVDFTDKTEQIHSVVDELLAGAEMNAFDVKKQQKTVKRRGVEGNISWTSRQAAIAGTAAQFAKLQEGLDSTLGKIGAQVLTVADDTYEGKKAKRMDIGIRDELEGDPLTIAADKIYLLLQPGGSVDKIAPKVEKEGKFKIALVIDDFGYTKAPITAYHEIDCPMTFAVLPNHPYSVEAAERGYRDGRQIILHLPMEALSDQAKEEPRTIHADMSENEIRAMVRELTDAVPYIIGVNNHQGSRVTSSRTAMRVVLNQLAEQGLFFLDSKTSASSKAYPMAKELGLPTAENHLFIDNSSDIKLIKAQMKKAAEMARQNGKVIVIGHARPNTAAALKEIVPELKAQGIQFVYASTLLE